MRLPGFLAALPEEVYAIDTGFVRPRFDAAYLLVSRGRAAFVDTAHGAAVPRLLESLQAIGLDRSAVDWVVLTHIHLDHAGGVGRLMAELPGACVLCHPRASHHVVDPSALRAGAVAVYGEEEVARTYGELLPVARERIVESSDGMVLEWAGRPLQLIDAPGHARHHHAIWDARSQGWFTGDAFGVSYPQLIGANGRFSYPSCTPVQFDPAAMRATIRRMLESQPRCIYPTHFGRLDSPLDIAHQLFAQIGQIERIADTVRQENEANQLALLRESLTRMTLAAMHEKGVALSDEEALPLIASDMELNAQGLKVWLAR